MEKQTLPNSTLVLVLGILSIIGCCCYGLPGIIFAIIALIVANKSSQLYKENPDSYIGYQNLKAGKIMAIIGIILSVLLIIYILWVISYLGWEIFQDPELLQEKLNELQNL
ncbi:MAG: CCC motif membrane protein [Aureibaculum sp.]|nr:CCC motif membrane protein [Aureibaculum sp.]